MSDMVYNKLSEYIAAEILKQPQRKISANEPLLSSGLVDSFSLVDISIFVEENFDVRIDDTELNVDSFDSLSQLVAMIEQRMV